MNLKDDHKVANGCPKRTRVKSLRLQGTGYLYYFFLQTARRPYRGGLNLFLTVDFGVMEDPYSKLADYFLAHQATLRGVVRQRLVTQQLALHMPHPPARVADVGGGAGHQAIPLARSGHEVTIIDPSEEMLCRAREALALEKKDVRTRVRLVPGCGEDAPRILKGEVFDAVLCHGVLMYLEHPEPIISAAVALACRGGVVSVLTKNADALAMRPALEGRYGEALRAFCSDRDRGRLGVVTRGDTVSELCRLVEKAGAEVVEWYGVRVFTDHLGDNPPDPNLPDVLKLEWEAGRRDPYRSVARLIHLIGQR